MGFKVTHGRIKPKYRRNPNAAEKRHEAHLYEQPCYGCGRHGVELHHTLLEFDGKAFRRDHRYQLPVCAECHRGQNGIHGIGCEVKWLESIHKSPEQAITYMTVQWGLSQRKAA